MRKLICALVIAVAMTAPTTGLGAAQDIVGAPIGDGVRAAVANGPSLVVVAFDAALGLVGQEETESISQTQDDVLAALPEGSVLAVTRFEHVPGMTLLLDDPSAIDILAQTPGVARVDLDVGGTGHLDVTVPLTQANQRHAVGNKGNGVVVAIIDSGIDSDHPDLAPDNIASGQACFGWDGGDTAIGFCPNGTEQQTGAGSAEDDAGHGTHVAGIVSGDGIVGSPGFAPGAETLAIKSTDNCNFSGCFYSFTQNIVAALDYIIANPQLNVKIINMSLGTGALFTGDCDTATSWTVLGASAINTLRANGVIAFASAGNNGSSSQMSAPACLSNVISVGASTDFDTPASFSNFGLPTDIFAPGVGVVSSAIGGSTVSASGTSMASPSAAGCAALLVESGEAITPDAIEKRLETSANRILTFNGGNYPRIDCGYSGLEILATPCAVHDSTDASASGTHDGPIPANTTRTVQVTGTLPASQGVGTAQCIPPEATAVVYTISAINPLNIGNLRLSAAGVVANGGVVNFANNGLNNANTVTIPLSATGAVDIHANVGSADVRLAALGYYTAKSDLKYNPLTPCAAADSRPAQNPSGSFVGPFAAAAAYPDVKVGGVFSGQGANNTTCGVPADADAVMINLVAIGAAGGKGFLSAATGGLDPFEPVTPFTNIALNNSTTTVVRLTPAGTISVDIDAVSGTPSTHIRVVVLGYFKTVGFNYTAVTPCAAFDTRAGNGASGSFVGKRLDGSATTYSLIGTIPANQGGGGGACGVPVGAKAVLINLVGIAPTAFGNFQAYATGSAPTGGVLNWSPLVPPMNNSNAVVVPISATGFMDLFTNTQANSGSPTIDARGVILGYYR